MDKCNRQLGDITSNNLKLWNDFTVKHEIELCRQCLLGIPEYNMKGMLAEYGKECLYTWLKRMSNAINEAKERFKDDIEYMKEIDDLEFLIDYEQV